MPNKEYDFRKVLAKYDKCVETTHHISPTITKPIITHGESDSFYITYTETGYNSSCKKTLYDFLYYYVRPYNDYLWERIIEMIQTKEETKLTPELKILPSNKIRYAYLHTNYYSGAGNLGSSCMRHKENQKSLNFYVKNNAQIVVVIDNNGKIHARALLWENVKSTEYKDTFTYLDRVYARSDKLTKQFYDLAKKNKWEYYTSTSAGQGRGSYYIDNINLKGVCHLPYTDTFRYLYYKDNLIGASTSTAITKRVKNKDFLVTLTNTAEGGYVPELDPDRVKEAITHIYISKKDAIRVKRYNGYVLKRNIVDINGDYYSKCDKAIIESKVDGFILKEKSVDEVFSNEPIDKTKAVYSEKHKGYIHKTNVVYIKDELYHIKDTDIIFFDGKWYHVSQCYVNYDREEVNKELVKQQTVLLNSLPETWSFWAYTSATVTKKGDLIPKELATIAYDLIYFPALNKLLYQERYVIKNKDLIKLITGEFIMPSDNNRKYLKRFNGKWYIRQEFEAPNKNQLQFAFMGSTKSTQEKK